MTAGKSTLAEIQAKDTPRFDWRWLGLQGTEGHEAELDAYFGDFAAPVPMMEHHDDSRCLGCNDWIFNSWSIAHGEAACRPQICGYPSRIYHYNVPGQTGRIIASLQYHPSVLRAPEPDTQEK